MIGKRATFRVLGQNQRAQRVLEFSDESDGLSRRTFPVLFPFRFFFFSREEERVHIHVESADGEAKYWLEPTLELARNHGFSSHDLRRIEDLIHQHEQEIRDAWSRHFGS